MIEDVKKTVIQMVVPAMALALLWLAGFNHPAPSAAPIVITVVGQMATPDVQTVVYGASWCGHCVTYEKTIRDGMTKDGWTVAEAGTKEAKSALIVFDKREDRATIQANKITGFPTTIIFRKGVEVKRFSGFMKPETLADEINNVIKGKHVKTAGTKTL